MRVAVRVPVAHTEAAAATLLELAPAGLEEVPGAEDVELAVYAAPDDVPAILSAFPTAITSPVEAGWEDAWRAFHRPVEAGGVWIGPPWETPPDGLPAVVIDPGRAFGTGAHPTTRLCVGLLAGLPRGSLLDVGCGSGVLSLAAARLGFGPIVAVDVDPIAVDVTRANAAANGVELEAIVADGAADALPAADIAVANVLLRPVEEILARLGAGTAVTSGYLAGERPAHAGWRHVASATDDGWAADAFRRAAASRRSG